MDDEVKKGDLEEEEGGCCGGGCADAAEARADEYLAGWKRAIADYQNREKELAREKREVATYAKETLALELLPALDNLRQAFTHVPEAEREAGWVKGIEYTVKQFEEALAREGVKSFPALGDKFDPARHEAVGEGEGEEGTVVAEIAPGYLSGERVLRPARVVVGKSQG